MMVPDHERIQFFVNTGARAADRDRVPTASFSVDRAELVRSFHRGLPGYMPTPLVRLDGLAGRLGIDAVWVKDESYRFGLNAFKVLGATHALGHLLARLAGVDIADIPRELSQRREDNEWLRGITLVTATDGNHGRAVAWAAEQLGSTAVVYLPHDVSKARYEAIKGHGAKVHIIEGNYDDAVRRAAERAAGEHWLLVQDTAWEGYEEIPRWIMQGYLTIMHEALEQLDGAMPTHLFVQCGVGSLAGALQGYVVERFGRSRPIVVVVEPTRAACFLKSLSGGGVAPEKVTGTMDTIMAGLACGKPSVLAWPIIRDYTDVVVACPDYVSVGGMRMLADPIGGDTRITSGESGAVTLGLLVFACEDTRYHRLKDALQLTERSRVLLVSTEGDTDPENYRRIVWRDAGGDAVGDDVP
jgi:diaminopropionate ammonia-lyase